MRAVEQNVPWQWNWVMERALLTDLTGRCLEVCIDQRVPEQLVPGEFVPLYRPIWPGASVSVVQAVKEAVELARSVQLTGSVRGTPQHPQQQQVQMQMHGAQQEPEAGMRHAADGSEAKLDDGHDGQYAASLGQES